MKALLLSLVLFLIWLPAAAAGEDNARVLTGTDLEAIFHEIIMESTSLPKERITIVNFSARPGTITIPNADFGYRLISQAHAHHLGRETIQIAVLVAGKEFGTIRMSGDLRLHGRVLSITRSLERHAILTESDFSVEERDISMLGSGLVQDPGRAVGMRLTTSVRPGAVLYERHLEEPPLVERGDLVTIFARSKQMEITVPGLARNSGALGEPILVKNLMSRRLVHAKVQRAGLVEVEF